MVGDPLAIAEVCLVEGRLMTNMRIKDLQNRQDTVLEFQPLLVFPIRIKWLISFFVTFAFLQDFLDLCVKTASELLNVARFLRIILLEPVFGLLVAGPIKIDIKDLPVFQDNFVNGQDLLIYILVHEIRYLLDAQI